MTKNTHSSSAIMWAVILVALLLVLALVPFAMSGKGPRTQANDEGTEVRIQPVARVDIESASPTHATEGANKTRDGEAIYNSVCMACHASGAAGAPKAGDKTAWAPRLAQGTATLVKNATTGKGAMPPKGGAADLSDSEIKAAVEHLIKLAR